MRFSDLMSEVGWRIETGAHEGAQPVLDAVSDYLGDFPEEDLSDEEALMALTATVATLADRFADLDPMDENDNRNSISISELEDIMGTDEILAA